MKFVEAEQPCLIEDRIGRKAHRIAVGDFLTLDLLAKTVNALMNIGHEFMEMRTALIRDGAVIKKQIHQHGLATPDLAMNVKAMHGGCVLVREQPLQQSAATGLVAGEAHLKRGKGLDGRCLGRIGLDGACGDESLIMPAEGGGRRSVHGLLTASPPRKMQDYKGARPPNRGPA